MCFARKEAILKGWDLILCFLMLQPSPENENPLLPPVQYWQGSSTFFTGQFSRDLSISGCFLPLPFLILLLERNRTVFSYTCTMQSVLLQSYHFCEYWNGRRFLEFPVNELLLFSCKNWRYSERERSFLPSSTGRQKIARGR
jgi:hypothetical protein